MKATITIVQQILKKYSSIIKKGLSALCKLMLN